MTASRISSTPSPVLALARIASWAGMPMMSSISVMTRSGSADGKSILFSTGTTVTPLLGRGVAVGDRLRLHALRSVDDQQRALAGGERARNLVRESRHGRGVDQIQVVARAVARDIGERRRLSLDGNAPLAFEVHGVQDLSFHLAVGEAPAALDEAVGKCRLAVVDVRDDREIADVQHSAHWALLFRPIQNKGAPRSAPCPHLAWFALTCPGLAFAGFCAGTA